MEKDNREIVKRLNVIIGLLLKLADLLNKQAGNKVVEKLRMAELKQFGLEPKEIGLFFGKSGIKVTKQIYETKRKRKSTKKKKSAEK